MDHHARLQLEAQNLAAVRQMVMRQFRGSEDFPPSERPIRITEGMLLSMHQRLMEGVPEHDGPKHPGAYRGLLHEVLIGGKTRPVEPWQVESKMRELLERIEKWDYAEGPKNLHFAGEIHYEFLCLHPFCDGNGRLSRILADMVLANSMGMMWLTLRSPPEELLRARRVDYIRVLGEADAMPNGKGVQYAANYYALAALGALAKEAEYAENAGDPPVSFDAVIDTMQADKYQAFFAGASEPPLS